MHILGWTDGMEFLKIITKARICGGVHTCRYIRSGQIRIAAATWINGQAHIHTAWADTGADHKERILTRMAG